MTQARSKLIENCQIGWPGKFLFRSHMLMPFPSYYHVPDSIDWCSSCCPPLGQSEVSKDKENSADNRYATQRMVAERAGKLSSN